VVELYKVNFVCFDLSGRSSLSYSLLHLLWLVHCDISCIRALCTKVQPSFTIYLTPVMMDVVGRLRNDVGILIICLGVFTYYCKT